MNLLDKYLLLEANTVSDEEYKRLTGSSLEDFRKRMKQHIAKVKNECENQNAREKKSRPDD